MTHTCPGLCGRTTDGVACASCIRQLPITMRTLLATTWWSNDWPAHSRAITDALLYLAAQHTRGRPWRTGPAWTGDCS